MKEKKGTDIERRQLMIRCDTDTQGQNSNRQESGCWTPSSSVIVQRWKEEEEEERKKEKQFILLSSS